MANGALGVMALENKVPVARFPGFNDYFDTQNKRFRTRFAPAYAITTPKGQGQGFPRVVVVLDTSFVPSPEWFYTAVSRASEECVVAGASDYNLQRLTGPSRGGGLGALGRALREHDWAAMDPLAG